jgi:hypothetical protein
MALKCSNGKIRYSTANAANTALANILDKPLNPEQLYYPTGFRRCPKCGDYHLTSKTGKAWKHGKRRNTTRTVRRR